MASRQGLKLEKRQETERITERRQWNGFPSGIETQIRQDAPAFLLVVASGMASRQGLKQVKLTVNLYRHCQSPVEWLPVRD